MAIASTPESSAPLTPQPEQAFLTLAEFAKLLGIGNTVAYELAQKNTLPVPVWRVGRQYRISRIACEQMLTAQHEPVRDDAA